jgi:hypothetical protein
MIFAAEGLAASQLHRFNRMRVRLATTIDRRVPARLPHQQSQVGRCCRTSGIARGASKEVPRRGGNEHRCR